MLKVCAEARWRPPLPDGRILPHAACVIQAACLRAFELTVSFCASNGCVYHVPVAFSQFRRLRGAEARDYRAHPTRRHAVRLYCYRPIAACMRTLRLRGRRGAGAGGCNHSTFVFLCVMNRPIETPCAFGGGRGIRAPPSLQEGHVGKKPVSGSSVVSVGEIPA